MEEAHHAGVPVAVHVDNAIEAGVGTDREDFSSNNGRCKRLNGCARNETID